MSSKQASRYLIQHELLPVVTYDIDTDSLRKHLDKVIFAVGDYAQSHNTFLYQAVQGLSKSLNCPYVVVPGHHGSYMDDTENWAKAIRHIITEYSERESND